MAENEKIVNLQLNEYEQPGLYIYFEDSTRLVLTRENTDRITREYWMDPDKIPQNVKEAVSFQRCDFCPLKAKEDFCDALHPTLPLLAVIDKFSSFDKVTVIYKGENKDLYHVSDTTLQRALRYISNLSLISYCRIGRKYRKYYSGIIPIMETDEIVNRMYLNMYWIHRGNENTVNNTISTMRKEITMTTQNQLERLRLICKNDAFLNAYVLTHMVTDVLYEFGDKRLKDQLEQFDPQH